MVTLEGHPDLQFGSIGPWRICQWMAMDSGSVATDTLPSMVQLDSHLLVPDLL